LQRNINPLSYPDHISGIYFYKNETIVEQQFL